MATRRKKSVAVSRAALERAVEGVRNLRRMTRATGEPFKPALSRHPPKAIPKTHNIAQDQALTDISTWAQSNLIGQAVHEGQVWLGYPELALLSQRSEYRVVSETLAKEMTRKWIRVTSKADSDDKTEKIEELTDRMDDLRTCDMFRKIAEQDGFFGRSHLYIDTGDTKDLDELKTPLAADKAKVNPDHPVVALRPVEAVWVYPTRYNADNPLRDDWYRPNEWHVMGNLVHSTRLLTFIGREVSDMLKPAYSFGGLSMSQMLKPYVDNWLRTRQSVADIISSFSVFALMTNLQESLNQGGEQLFRRAELFNLLRDNMGMLMLDKDSEDFKNISASLATLDVLQAQTQEHMAAVAQIPLVKLLGIQPQGLNADSEGVLRAFYDHIAATQEKFFTVHLNTVFALIQLSLWGEVDEDLGYEWEPLTELSEEEQAQVDKVRAETGDVLIGNGTLHPVEERRRIATDPETRYQGLDVEDVPEPEDEEIEPKNIRERVEGQATGEQEEVEPGKEREAADDGVIPFVAAEALDVALDEAGFVESQHPRDTEGKFAYKATSSGRNPHVIVNALKSQGFSSAKKSPAGKPVYKHPGGATVVVEPPAPGGKYSSNWTLYEKPQSGPSETHKGSGAKALHEKIAELGHATKSFEPVKAPSIEHLAAKHNLKSTGEIGDVRSFLDPHGITVHLDIKTEQWSVGIPGKPGKYGKGTSDLDVAISEASKPEPVKPEPVKPEPVKPEPGPSKWNTIAGQAANMGLKIVSNTMKTQIYESPKGKVEVDPETGEWLAQSQGHITKKGTGLENLEKLYAGKPGSFANAPGQTELYPPPKPPAPPKPPPPPETSLQQELKKVAPTPSQTEEHALGVYGDGAYGQINDKLRDSAGKTNDPQVKAIDEFLARSEIPKDVVLYRKVGGQYAKFMKSILVQGTVFTDHGFSSTSTHPGVWSGELHFVINVPKGSKGASIAKWSGNPGENEVLLPRGTVYRVTSFDHAASKAHVDVVTEGHAMQPKKTTDAAIPEEAEPQPMTEEESERYTWHEGDIVILEQPGREKKTGTDPARSP